MSVFDRLFGRKRVESDASAETVPVPEATLEPAGAPPPPAPTSGLAPAPAPTPSPPASPTPTTAQPTPAQVVETAPAPKPDPPPASARPRPAAAPVSRTPPPHRTAAPSLESAVEAAVDALIAPAAAPTPGGERKGSNNRNGNGKTNGRGNGNGNGNGKTKAGTSTAADLAALHATYAELSVEYCAPVRNVMIEVRWGEPPVLWLELVRGALGSLQAMAAEVELGQLAAALERFGAVMATAVRSGRATVDAELRRKLLDAYAPLITCLPRAFDLDGERDRREPVILRCLLLMVPGILPLAIDRCLAAGLTRVEAIVKSPPEEIAAVTGLDLALCRQLVDLARAEGRIGAGDVGADRQRLQALVGELGQAHLSYEAASASWGASSRADKRRFRDQRQRTWLKVQLALARLGEVDRIDRIERLPFARRIEDLESYLRTLAPVGSARARGAAVPATTTTTTTTEPTSPQGI